MSYLEDLQTAHKARRARLWPTPPPQPKCAAVVLVPDDSGEIKRLRLENDELRLQLAIQMEAAKQASGDPAGSIGQARPILYGPIPSIDCIIRTVADFYGIARIDILSPRRQAKYVRPRQIAIYLAKKLTMRSFPTIGRKFGNRDHTTILHAVRKIEKLRPTDAQLSDELIFLEGLLTAAEARQ